jgi:hypothetical protein
LFGAPLAFGEASLREMVEWVADEFTGEGKPFSGVLILFDEFSTFVESYAHGATFGEAAPLQDLLSGVERRRGKVTFVAFAQLDPRNSLEQSSSSQVKVAGVLKELDRLDQTVTLRSVLEEVVDAYLAQDDPTWRKLQEEPIFRREIEDAASITLGLFQRRYREELGWNPENFQNKVVKGCFPLHPLTTALFATLKFGRTSQPRSVLRFVFDQVSAKAKEPVLRDDGRVNWVLPIVLVDEFTGMFPESTWTMYQQASISLGPEADPLLHMVLKAVLLIVVGELPTEGCGSDTLIAHLCGHDRRRVQEALRRLTQQYILRYDEAKQRYSFWFHNIHCVEQLLQQKLASLKLTMPILHQVVDTLQESEKIKDIPVDVPWASSPEWSFKQTLTTVAECSEEAMRKLLETIVVEPKGTSTARGLLILVLAETNEDIEHFRRNVDAVLAQALKAVGYPQLPVVLIRSQQPNPDLLRSVKRVAALLQFNSSERDECGKEQFEALLKHELEQAGKLLERHRSRGVAIVPRSLGITTTPKNLDDLLKQAFLAAFRQRPQEFFKQYSSGSTMLSSAVINFSHALALNNLGHFCPGITKSNKVAQELYDRFLGPSGKWKVIDDEGWIQSPLPMSPLHSAWQVLDEKIWPGAKGVQLGPILKRLLNPPYGYDAATLLLLLSTWYGHNRPFLELSIGGRLRPLDELTDPAGKGSSARKIQEVLASLASATISRRDPGELVCKAQAIVERVEWGERVPAEIAQQNIDVLRQALEVRDLSNDQVQRFTRTKDKLENDLHAARKYTEHIESIKAEAKRVSDVRKLLSLLDELASLEQPNGVVEAEPKTHAQQEVKNRLQDAVKTSCQRLGVLTHHVQYNEQDRELAELQEELQKRNLAGLVQQVAEARARLANERERLEQHEKDRVLIEQIDAMGVNDQTGLATLRRYLEELARLQAATEQGQQQIETKRKAVQSAIAQLEDQLGQLENRLRTVSDSKNTRLVRDQILQQRYRYEGTPEVETIEQLQQRATNLEAWFNALEQLQQREPRNLAEAEQAQQHLKELVKDCTWLSETQLQVWNQADQQLQAWFRRKTESERSKLNDLERRIQARENPHQLAKALQLIELHFLSEADKERLARLQQKIQEMLEEDAEGQVIRYFSQIRDPQRRWALLQRLMNFVDVTEGT